MYLLKLKFKSSHAACVEIGQHNVYKEFDSFIDILSYMHEKALYIENFTLLEVKEALNNNLFVNGSDTGSYIRFSS